MMGLTGLPSGTVFPILARLEGLGWLESGWEHLAPSVAGGSRRRYYRLTRAGVHAATPALTGVSAERLRRTSRLQRPAFSPRPGLAGGVA